MKAESRGKTNPIFGRWPGIVASGQSSRKEGADGAFFSTFFHSDFEARPLPVPPGGNPHTGVARGAVELARTRDVGTTKENRSYERRIAPWATKLPFSRVVRRR